MLLTRLTIIFSMIYVCSILMFVVIADYKWNNNDDDIVITFPDEEPDDKFRI